MPVAVFGSLRVRLCLLLSLLILSVQATPGSAATVRQGVASPLLRFIQVRGYLMDGHPATDGVLKIYSKTHRRTYDVAMAANTVVREHSRIVPRTTLRRGQYVIASCTRVAGGSLQAVRVTIVVRRTSRKATRTTA